MPHNFLKQFRRYRLDDLLVVVAAYSLRHQTSEARFVECGVLEAHRERQGASKRRLARHERRDCAAVEAATQERAKRHVAP